ncbi:MAG: phenylalanine--tRNA ligase subunit beta [Microbacteriaceae bacterium]
MRVPLKWLGEFVDLPSDVTPEHVHAALVKVGFEEEDVHTFDLTGPIVVGRVLSIEPEPQSNGKTINWCQVDVGEPEPRGIVCGAHNFVVGDKVVVSLPGAVLPGPFPIAARKTYGHVSDGMIASARELGLGDEHDGILLLSSFGLDPELGTDAITLLGLDDTAVEINVTPDRGYAFSLRGVAREYSHSTGSQFRDPVDGAQVSPASGFVVTVDDVSPVRGNAGVRAFVTQVVRNIDPGAVTPPWMVARLTLAGVRSISIAVDITNYVMFELGQPLHAYDLDTITGGITVRRAVAGETVQTLDGKVRTLSVEDLLITDESGPIGIAGVMGGAKTEISSTTRDVLIEAANFEPVSIARSARRHKLPSEASKRFERGVDPAIAAAGAARVAQLLVELAGGVHDTLGSTFDQWVAPASITLRDGAAAALIGVDYSDAEVEGTLALIGASVEKSDNGLVVTPPSWRPDLTDGPTLVEEIARIVGYDRIPSRLPVAPPGRGLTREQRMRRTASQTLAAGGLTEVLAYPFLSSEREALFSVDGVTPTKLANALDSEAPFLRTSLIPGLLEISRRNLSRGLTDLALYEVGHVYLPSASSELGSASLPIGNVRPSAEVLTALNAGIPAQPWHVAALFAGDSVTKQPGQASVASGLSDALDAARALASALAVDLRIVQGSHPSLHPGRTAELLVGEQSVGFAGELLPTVSADLDLPRVVAVLELDLDELIAHGAVSVDARPIVGFPAATQDLSLVVSAHVAAGDVLATIYEGAGILLEHAHLVDDYRGQGIDTGQKSLTFALRFRASDRTLTAAEATEAKLSALALAADRFQATLRE